MELTNDEVVAFRNGNNLFPNKFVDAFGEYTYETYLARVKAMNGPLPFNIEAWGKRLKESLHRPFINRSDKDTILILTSQSNGIQQVNRLERESMERIDWIAFDVVKQIVVDSGEAQAGGKKIKIPEGHNPDHVHIIYKSHHLFDHCRNLINSKQGNTTQNLQGVAKEKEKEEYTGGSVSYYKLWIANPTSPGVDPYIAECNDIIEALKMTYAEGNVFKAIWRMCAARNLGKRKEGYKDDLYDAEKVVFFGNRTVVAAKNRTKDHVDSQCKNNPNRSAKTSTEA